MKPINPLNIHPEIRDYEAAHSLKCSGWPGDPNSDAVVERLIEIHPVFIARKFDSSIMGVQHTLVQRVCYSGYSSKSGRQAVVSFGEFGWTWITVLVGVRYGIRKIRFLLIINSKTRTFR